MSEVQCVQAQPHECSKHDIKDLGNGANSLWWNTSGNPGRLSNFLN